VAITPVRGDKVIEFAKNFLDETIPLQEGSYKDVLGFDFADGNILQFFLKEIKLNLKIISIYWISNNGDNSYGFYLKIIIYILKYRLIPKHPIGQTDKAGIKDILMESAITTIQDCEDSVAAVDGEDKTQVYRNWLGL
jgi:malate synthase